MYSKYAIVLALATLLIGSVCTSALAQDVEADIAAITEVMNQATLACATGDVELYLSRFTEDVVAMPPGIPTSIGIAESRAAMEALFGAYDLALPYTVQEVVVPGDWAFARSTFVYSMTPKEGGETTTFIGKELDIFKRQADGSWKMYIECYNFDAPPPAAKLAGTSRAPGLAKMAQEDAAEAIVREIYDRYALSVKTGDIDLHMSFWDDNGIKMLPGAPAFIGKEGIRALMEVILGASDEEAPYVLDEAEIAGDWAFGRATWTLFQTPKEGGPTTTFRLSSLDIFKKQADGSWKMYIDAANFHGPPTVTSVEVTSWGQVKEQFE